MYELYSNYLGLPQKFPGFIFSSYSQVRFALKGLISFDQAIDMSYFLIDQKGLDIERKEQYEKYFKWKSKWEQLQLNSWISNCDTTFYPKSRLLIKVQDNSSNEEREFISYVINFYLKLYLS